MSQRISLILGKYYYLSFFEIAKSSGAHEVFQHEYNLDFTIFITFFEQIIIQLNLLVAIIFFVMQFDYSANTFLSFCKKTVLS